MLPLEDWWPRKAAGVERGGFEEKEKAQRNYPRVRRPAFAKASAGGLSVTGILRLLGR